MAPSKKRRKHTALTTEPALKREASTNIGLSSKRVKSAPTQVGANEKRGLTSLPAEIRNEIYRLTLVEDDVIWLRVSRLKRHERPWVFRFSITNSLPVPWREPGVLLANRAIRAEATKMYYKSNDFGLCMEMADAEAAAQWLRYVSNLCGSEPFGHFSFFIPRSRWLDFHHSRALTNLAFHNDLFLNSKAPESDMESFIRERPSYLFRFGFTYEISLHVALEEAVIFGRQARAEGWTQEWLDVEFGVWLDEKLSEPGVVSRVRMEKRMLRNAKKRVREWEK